MAQISLLDTEERTITLQHSRQDVTLGHSKWDVYVRTQRQLYEETLDGIVGIGQGIQDS